MIRNFYHPYGSLEQSPDGYSCIFIINNNNNNKVFIHQEIKNTYVLLQVSVRNLKS